MSYVRKDFGNDCNTHHLPTCVCRPRRPNEGYVEVLGPDGNWGGVCDYQWIRTVDNKKVNGPSWKTKKAIPKKSLQVLIPMVN